MTGRYRTLVIDPPWHYGKALGFKWRQGRPSGQKRDMLDYPTMTMDEIASLPVGDLALPDAHLFVWTTQRYLFEMPRILAAWGFEHSTLLVWAKAPTGFSLGGAFGKSLEFVDYARRGKPETLSRVNRDWWQWPRAGHSAKPEAFLDTVEQVCPGPYLELFARRQRLGWSTWGDQCFDHVQMEMSGES